MPKKPDNARLSELTTRLGSSGQISTHNTAAQNRAEWAKFWQEAYQVNSASGRVGTSVRNAFTGGYNPTNTQKKKNEQKFKAKRKKEKRGRGR